MEIVCVSGFQNRGNVFLSGDLDNQVQVILIKRSYVPISGRGHATRGHATATRVAGSPTGERPGNRHCLIKAAGRVGKESFTPHLQFPQRVTQARILEDMKQKVWGGPKAPTASGLSLDNSGKTPLNQHLGKKNKRGKMGVSKLLKDREEENSFRKTRLPTRFKQNQIPARSSNQRKCDPN